jgi:ligand-binding SRPBCC domain-containing protein
VAPCVPDRDRLDHSQPEEGADTIVWLGSTPEALNSTGRFWHGPYRFWRHLHEFISVGHSTCVRDRVEYALPLGRLGDLLGLRVVRRDLVRIFDYRWAVVARLLG